MDDLLEKWISKIRGQCQTFNVAPCGSCKFWEICNKTLRSLPDIKFTQEQLIGEIVLSVVENCQAPLADDGVSVVECDEKKATEEISKILQSRPMK